MIIRDFPGGSAGQESACSAGNPSSITGWRRSPGEGIGYLFQCSGLENSMDCIVGGVAESQTQLSDFHFHTFPGGSDGKEAPAMRQTQVQSPGWEDPLEKGMATHSSIPAWRIPWTEGSMGSQKLRHD